ncbi:glycosyltransferase family 2 protein [Roseinatronobacter monicus]|uniref:glycosyltransferase family 2 protein n=1 Tax=Roseinatronobacter monicus TaxID=393481 RepID=UPI003CCC5B08
MLSIIIPTHHRPDLLIRAVSSALSSCAVSDEVLVVADRDPGARAVLARWTDDLRVKVLDNTGQGGASDTRNFGVVAATGDTVLFLDDDDALVPGYADRVRAITTATWGFGSQIIRHDGDENTALTLQSDLKGGVAGAWVPFRRKIAALGAGLWVRRSLFNAVGGLSCDQRVDEDTDLCCRLLAAGHQPWIDPPSSHDHRPACGNTKADKLDRCGNARDLLSADLSAQYCIPETRAGGGCISCLSRATHDPAQRKARSAGAPL